MSTDNSSPTRVEKETVKDITNRKRKSLQKDLKWNEAMLLNIFEENELTLHEGAEEDDPFSDDDYIGYFRIMDAIEENSIPREELNKIYLEHRQELRTSNSSNQMKQWWNIFAKDPKLMTPNDSKRTSMR